MKNVLRQALQAYKDENRLSFSELAKVVGVSRPHLYASLSDDRMDGVHVDTYLKMLDRVGIVVKVTVDARKAKPAYQILNEMEKQ
jgi:DNA-binding phage protein